jgi:hypothetical protein
MIKVHGERIYPIPVNQGIRQGDLLRPLFFNIVMHNRGFKMGHSEIKIICYADDAVLLSDNEDDLQRILFNFNKAAKNVNMEIANEKTKSMIIVKISLRCKIDITSQGLLKDEVKIR